MSIAKNIKEQSVLVIVDSKKYADSSLNIIKETAKDYLCYVSLNKTFHALDETLKKKKIPLKNIKIIDAITRLIKDADNTKDCTYIASPEALTDLSITITTHLKYPFDYLVVDSLTNLFTYHDINTIKRFVKNLIAKIHTTKCTAVFIAVKTPETAETINTLKAFTDQVIEL